MTDKPLNRLAEDGMLAERSAYYAAIYPHLREIARDHGYALALHGSLIKDLDLVAVPWTEEAVDEATLVRAIVDGCGGYVPPPSAAQPYRQEKPHGRVSWTIFLGRDGGYIDLGVMPRTAPCAGS